MEIQEKDRISPEKAIEILKKGGMEVDMEQARLILEFLYKLAAIAMEQTLKTTS